MEVPSPPTCHSNTPSLRFRHILPTSLTVSAPPVRTSDGQVTHPDTDGDTCGAEKSYMRLILQVSYLGLCLCIIFTGFNVPQGYITSMFPGYFGYVILSIKAFAFGLSALLSTSIRKLIVTRCSNSKTSTDTLGMFVASFGYLSMAFAIYARNQIMIVVTSFLSGFGGGIMWVLQGIWLTKMVAIFEEEAPEYNVIGAATGVLFMIYNMNGVIGNTTAFALLKSNTDFETMLLMMAIVCCVGCFMLLFVASPKQKQSRQLVGTKGGGVAGGCGPRLDTYITFLKDPRIYQMTPYMFCQGVHLSYSVGNLATIVVFSTKRLSETPPDKSTIAGNVALVGLLYGVGCVCGSFITGRMYDWLKSRLLPLIALHLFLMMTANSILISTVIFTLPQSIIMLALVGFILGYVDFLVNGIINGTNSRIFQPAETQAVFSWYRFCFCIGNVIASISSGFLPSIQTFQPTESNMFLKFGWLLPIMINLSFMFISAFSGSKIDRILQKKGQEEAVFQ